MKVSVTLDRPRAIKVISSVALKSTESPCTRAVLEAGEDAYDRLIEPSIERESARHSRSGQPRPQSRFFPPICASCCSSRL